MSFIIYFKPHVWGYVEGNCFCFVVVVVGGGGGGCGGGGGGGGCCFLQDKAHGILCGRWTFEVALNSPLGWSSTWRALLRKIRLTLSCQNPRVQSRLFWNYPRVISTAMEAMAHGSFSSVIGGNLEVKLPTIWTDEAAEMGSREEKETEEKKSENRKAEERRSSCAKR